MKDRELTRLLQAHPEEGLEAAMLEYAPLVKGILCRILPQNPCDREECMADVFVALWRSAAKLEAARTPRRCAGGGYDAAGPGYFSAQILSAAIG